MRPEPVRQPRYRMDHWYAISATLLAGRDSEILPMLHATLRALLRNTHDGAARLYRKDFGDAQLNGLLNGEIHPLARTQALHERHGDGSFRLARVPTADADRYALFGDGLNLRVDLAPGTVEYDHRISDIES